MSAVLHVHLSSAIDRRHEHERDEEASETSMKEGKDSECVAMTSHVELSRRRSKGASQPHIACSRTSQDNRVLMALLIQHYTKKLLKLRRGTNCLWETHKTINLDELVMNRIEIL